MFLKEPPTLNIFKNEDHSYTAAIYPDPVHYEEDEEWKEVDNQLVDGEAEEGKQFLENKENLFKVKFSKKSNGSKLVKVKIDDFDISWDLKGAAKVDTVPLDADHSSTMPHLNSHMDFKNRIIYELKPYNKTSYNRALRQANTYAKILGGKWNIVIDMYR